MRSHRYPLGWIRQAGFTFPCKFSRHGASLDSLNPTSSLQPQHVEPIRRQRGGPVLWGGLIPTQALGFSSQSPACPAFLSCSLFPLLPVPQRQDRTITHPPTLPRPVRLYFAIWRRTTNFVSSSNAQFCVDRCSLAAVSESTRHNN